MKITCLRILMTGLLACWLILPSNAQSYTYPANNEVGWAHIVNEGSEARLMSNCRFSNQFVIKVANLDLMPINQNPAPSSDKYRLPTGAHRLFVYYTFNGESGVKEIKYFSDEPNYPYEVENGSEENMFYAFIQLENPVDLSVLCAETSTETEVPWYLSLKDENGNPYPICNYVGVGDVFSCTAGIAATNGFCTGPGGVFNNGETCNSSDLATEVGTVTFDCGECGPDDEFGLPRLTQQKENDLDPINEEQLIISPNPFHSNIELRIEGAALDIESLTLVDLSGKLIEYRDYTSAKRGTSIRLNTDHLPIGMYLLKVKRTNGSSIHKLIKQ